MKLYELERPILIENLLSSLTSTSNYSSVLSSELNIIKTMVANQQKKDSGQEAESPELDEFNNNSKKINEYFDSIQDPHLKTIIKTIIYKSGFVMPIGNISSDKPPVLKRIITNIILAILSSIMAGKTASDDIVQLLTTMAQKVDALFKASSYNTLLSLVESCFDLLTKLSHIKGQSTGLAT
jgi:hypothetical protein